MNSDDFSPCKDSPARPLHTHEHHEIIVSCFEMVRPYNHSELKLSVFHGYFNLCYVMSIFFIAVYPIRNYIIKGIFCKDEVLKLLETNIVWDCISMIVFTIMGVGMLMLPQRWVRLRPVQVVLLSLYLSVGHFIVKNNQMYFSDRAFVICLCWGFAAKLYSYFNANEKKATPQDQLNFFFSPCLVYDGFAEGRLPQRRILLSYVVKKLLLIFVCLFVNCIIVVQFIDPVIASCNRMSLIELVFNLIPPVFYINMSLIYTVFECTFAPLAELTKMKDRRFFDDWWNSTDIYELLAKINLLTQRFLHHHVDKALEYHYPAASKHLQKIKMVVLLCSSELIALQIFDRAITLAGIAMFIALNSFVIAFCDRSSSWLNNYVVHSVFICFFPVMIAIELKMQLFTL